MKKSLLLCTVSGVLLYSYSNLSYALNATTTPPSTGNYTPGSSKAQPASTITTPTGKDNPTSSFSSKENPPTTVPSKSSPLEKPASSMKQTSGNSTSKQGSSDAPKPEAKSPSKEIVATDEVAASGTPRTLTQTSGDSATTLKAQTTANVQSTPIKPQSTGNDVTRSTTKGPQEPTTTDISSPAGETLQLAQVGTKPTETGTGAKSRRRQGAEESPSTKPSTKENSPNFPVSSTQSEPKKPATGVPPTLVKQVTEQPVAVKPVLEKKVPEQPIAAQPEKPMQIEEVQSGIRAVNGETVALHNAKIYDRNLAVIAEGKNSVIKIVEGTVTANFIALAASDGGAVYATGVAVTTVSAGLVNTNATINLKDSTVHVTGDYAASGIIFLSNPYIPRERYTRSAEKKANADNAIQEQNLANQVNLNNTKLFVKNGVGISIYGADMSAEISLKNSEIHADVLLKNTKEKGNSAHPFTLTADHSFLEGRVRTLAENKTVFDLKNHTKWFLKEDKNVLDDDKNQSNYKQFGVNEKSYSNLSRLSITDSSVVFDKPIAGYYQTLFVGPKSQQGGETSNKPVAYSATGTAEIHLNTKWSSHSPVREQETDRVVIDGDVSGSTIVHINLLEKDQKITDSSSIWGEHMASLPSETHGISVIQVSGKANENSFKLAGEYITMGGLPYKYVLTAYAPGASHANQNLFGKNDNNFWDYRLQNAYIDKDKKIRALLPQVANYLVTPSALFSAEFSDVNNQNALLDNMRATVFGAENNKKKGIFFSSYGEKVTLFSNRDPLHYGYGADVNYTALQGGVVLATLESKDISTHFGLVGTYGKLAFTPKDMEDSEKTALDKWSLTAYSGIQHSSGLYVNTLLSYGKLKGNITTALVGNAAKLDGTEMLSASATVGQKLATSSKRLMFEPQAQLVYQNLLFNVFSDANNLEVDMGNPRQWLVRLGGRLTQTLTTTEEKNAISLYGKLNVLKAFGDGGTIKIADTFYLDPTGSSIEGGIGVNAYLSQNIAFHGDISYKQKLQKAGVSGTNFSGGIRYHF
ncbi:autotransporter outer membrane beta-barrel domain-containing protein [Bartonella taylorii]|uniref:Outer membrane autotransporter barrel domain-containing protein n=1 Tax=Bartonella taylorii 8TBB TaxID=1094560 RepID=A0A9P2RY39_BARTA|nr:autotransporter outer membrane beta-barrel domain-containing protein [Bartonella taylorii]EJF92399.1 outer membrane autotransporter barrel domain-containing protein [Bartonella taylorii 8TBB]USP01401.1 autotransporter outer membrane beta-barrel domain-containing protein [Bartonella taylorii]